MSESTQAERDEERDFAESSDEQDSTEDSPSEPETLEEELEQVREERDEFREKYLRKSADLQNLRERKEKERKNYMKYANKDLLKDLLEVLDNFERAQESMDIESEDVREGVQMIYRQLQDLLDKYNVESVDAEGEPFDPHRHEGMMREEVDELDEQTVLDVFQEGYKLHDQILRPAQVKVGVPAPVEESEEDDS